jgi:ABC-type transport system substrate-binding protein
MRRGERPLVPSRRRILSAPALAALVLLALAGCGGGDARTAASARTATVTKTLTVPSSTSGTTAPPAAGTSTAAAPPPNPSARLSLHAAEQTLDARGYAPLTERDWRPDQPLKVLIGISRAGGPRAELAFFFVGDRFIGTDASDPSAQLAVAAQGDRSVTLDYALYKPSDPVDAPSGPTMGITFVWTGARLLPQAPIPTDARDAPLSRR